MVWWRWRFTQKSCLDKGCPTSQSEVITKRTQIKKYSEMNGTHKDHWSSGHPPRVTPCAWEQSKCLISGRLVLWLLSQEALESVLLNTKGPNDKGTQYKQQMKMCKHGHKHRYRHSLFFPRICPEMMAEFDQPWYNQILK